MPPPPPLTASGVPTLASHPEACRYACCACVRSMPRFLLAVAGCVGYPTAPLAARGLRLAGTSARAAPSWSLQMSRICDITGKRANNANRVTFSNKKNARLQHVNLQTKRFFSPELNRNVKLKVATSTMRTITKLGLDETAKKYGVDLSKY